MSTHPGLDLTGHESYDPKAIQQVDNDLMKYVLSALSFPLLDSLRSSNRLMTFEEILAISVDEDEDYLRFKDEGRKNTLNPVEIAPTKWVEQVGTAAEAEVQVCFDRGEEMKIRGVRETLSEVLAKAESSFAALGAMKTGP